MEGAVLQLLEQGGIWLYLLFMTVLNVIIVPLPNDLFIFGAPLIYQDQFWEVLLFSNLAAVLSAIVNFTIGYHYGPAVRSWILSKSKKHEKTLDKACQYGPMVVAISAITPLPFSLACWGCGIARCRYWVYMGAVILTRLPRNTLICLVAWNIL